MIKYKIFQRSYIPLIPELKKTEDIPYNPEQSDIEVRFNFPYPVSEEQFKKQLKAIALEILEDY